MTACARQITVSVTQPTAAKIRPIGRIIVATLQYLLHS
jgi:hypothetical protein